jgi:enoyl-CoA hydratase/carnithine racemase
MRSDQMTKEDVLAVLDQAIREHAGGHPNSLMAAERALWKCTRATVEGLWEERERLQATLNNTLAERDAAEHVAQSSRISAIDAESRATRAEAAERDARRYRFLRELSEAKLPIIAAWGASGDAEYLDAAIDAALSGTVKQGEG